jgi:hypothetical protein
MATVDVPPTALAPPDRLARTLPRFLAVVAQLALILAAVRLLRIEPNRPFFAVMYLAAGGFVIHAWLPRRFRPAFFVLLSLAALVLILGWETAAWVLGLGGGLLGLCLLPVPLRFRVLLVAAAGAGLFLWRADSAAAFWPILGSMFMFRLIVYLYDTRHERSRPPLAQTLAYFFPLPNVCFPFFPVLDYKTFREIYYDDEPYAIYQSGVDWIVRGLTHLLAYRLVKYYVLPQPHEMTDLPHLALFLAANYALYLRVSGWFHIITGVLHLFGFNLPRTHDNYFLASSVSDIWRRINIYWKDFMSKVFFYPAFFALRGWGTRAALAAAGLWVFVMTWLLHTYQVFWLRGELPLSRNEALLWLAAGLAVILNMQLDLFFARRGARPVAAGPESLRAEAVAGAVLALKIAGTFFLVSLFWACWTLPRFPRYLWTLASPGGLTLPGILALLACLAGVAAVGALVRLAHVRFPRYLGMLVSAEALATMYVLAGLACVAGVAAVGVLARLAHVGLSRNGVLVISPFFARGARVAALLGLVAVGIPEVGAALGPQAGEVLATLRLDAVTPVEAAVTVQGYYEEVTETRLQVAPLLDLPGLTRRQESSRGYADMTRPSDAFLERELIPGWSGEIGGRRLTINHLGMRDREGLTREKPAGVCRLAFVGSSVVMGWGVGDDETLTRVLEARLRAERKGGAGRIEVLNFGTGRSHAIHRRVLVERKVFGFDPDAIYYIAHQDEYQGTTQHLARLLAGRHELPAYLREVARRARITPKMGPGEIEVRLQKFAVDIVRGVYADLAADCHKRRILPVWVYVPIPGVVSRGLTKQDLADLRGAGLVVIDLSDWAKGYAPEQVMADRHHANALGHRLIAERLQAVLRSRPGALPACARP